MYTLEQLIGALYNTGFLHYGTELDVQDNVSTVQLCGRSSFKTWVAVILEDEERKIFVLKDILRLPVDCNCTSSLIIQQQANLLLEEHSCPGRIVLNCMDTDDYGVENANMFVFMYSHIVPCIDQLDVDIAAQLVVSACGALEMLSNAFADANIEEKIVDGVLSPTDAFLVDIDQEKAVEIKLHPALPLMSIPEEQRNSFMSFLQEKGITVDEFMNSKKLDLFCVATDSIALTVANGCGGCWELGEIPIRKMTHAELERIVSPLYALYTAGCKLLGLAPRSLDSVIWDIQYYI